MTKKENIYSGLTGEQIKKEFFTTKGFIKRRYTPEQSASILSETLDFREINLEENKGIKEFLTKNKKSINWGFLMNLKEKAGTGDVKEIFNFVLGITEDTDGGL